MERLVHVEIPARDGTPLAAAVFLPGSPDAGPWPAILDAVPYRKDDDFRWLDWATYAAIADEGVACVRVDCRGTGSSGGVLEDEYAEVELCDHEDAIAWIARQPWCSGRVGMTGVSWGGFTAVQVAMRRPPALGAIAPIHFTVDRFGCDVHCLGGRPTVLEQLAWPGSMLVENALPPDPAVVGAQEAERRWRERLDGYVPWPLRWLGEQRRSAYWRHGSLCEDWASIEVPVLAIGGWMDGYVEACLAVLEHVRAPRRAVIAACSHSRPNRAWPGPAYEHRRLLARWFRHHLAGEENGVDVEPVLVCHVADRPHVDALPDDTPGRFRALGSWPPARRPTLVVHLAGADLRARPPRPDELEEPARTWRGPWDVGRTSPFWCWGAPPTGGAQEASADDAGSLVWDSLPLGADLVLLGAARVEVEATCDRTFGLLAARLEAVDAEGRSRLLAKGRLDLRHRAGSAEPRDVVPGERMDVALDLHPVGTTVPAGWRLRLAVAGSDWPHVWPPPGPFALAIHGGRVALPVFPDADEVPCPPLPAPLAEPPNGNGYGDPPLAEAWRTVRDELARETRVEVDAGWDGWLDDGGRTLGESRLVVAIRDDDPLACRGVVENRALAAHPGLTADARSRLAISADADAFHVEIDVAVDRDGEPFWQRSWRERIPRDDAPR